MSNEIDGTSICFTDLTVSQIHGLLKTLGEPGYRVKQIQSWTYKRSATSFDEMTDLPEPLRRKLAQKMQLHCLTKLRETVSKDRTVKTLFTLADGKTIESALMSYPGTEGRYRYTVCVSTQVGCSIGCSFCATGQQGFERNLTAGEIIDQVLYFVRRLKDNDEKDTITNIVFMGMGEPLANYEALWQAIATLNSSECFGLGARHMTISTAGLIPQIKRLSQEKLQVGLAISLHSSDNTLRNKLVPINNKYPLKELISVCHEYYEITRRRLSFEYILFEDINDSVVQARNLAELLIGLNCHVNLIQANFTKDKHFRPSNKHAVQAFQEELQRLGINCTLRQRKGIDIDAGCGQLRSRFLK